ncbi:hypothetical protein CAPTEDRAFT_196518 [Capitella teleta]|uniref:Uncharacterized protein n=1 Tax=Capitella teleta TaxID=283909 RepID=R7V3K3_CAPTE|nr:hypothetical protein CAPTEDRAFT_196518 [Capitella teleta]|eukprot:ELU13428.1 hypothetical protein CAPTEDRAFT_196518 [Capitella teleta]
MQMSISLLYSFHCSTSEWHTSYIQTVKNPPSVRLLWKSKSICLLAISAILCTCSLSVSFFPSTLRTQGTRNRSQFAALPPPAFAPLLPICSNDFLRDFATKHHRYPDSINWHSNYSSFSPASCRVVSHNILKCLKRKKMKRIAVYGASQVKRYRLALVEALERAGLSCDYVSQEERQPLRNIDMDYFAAGNKTLRSSMVVGQDYGCTGCSGSLTSCKYKNSSEFVMIEHISTENVNTKYLILNESIVASTFEKFIFNVHLKDSFPDLSVFFVPMNHIKQNPVWNFHHDFPRALLPVVKKAKPPQCDFFFIPGTAEFEQHRKAHNYKDMLWYGLLATDAIRRLNAELFKLLEGEVTNKKSKIYSFLDLVDVTLPVSHLSLDGVHFTPEWYSVFWKVFLDVYCQNK